MQLLVIKGLHSFHLKRGNLSLQFLQQKILIQLLKKKILINVILATHYCKLVSTRQVAVILPLLKKIVFNSTFTGKQLVMTGLNGAV